LYYLSVKSEITDANPYIMKKNYWDLFEEGMVGVYFLRVDFSACYWV
jgi:hypothetical protein